MIRVVLLVFVPDQNASLTKVDIIVQFLEIMYQ
jgi:hypothetical protein